MRSDQFQLHARLEQTHWWFVGRRRILRSVVERILPPHTNRTVIDVGCGTGGNIATLADAYRCYGIDTSREAIELARQRFPHVQFYCGQAPDDLGARMQQADLVLLMDVLEHVRDDVDLLRTLVDSLTPGARLLITVPADASLWSQHDLSFGHYRRYDEQQFRHLWESLPVATCMVSYFNARLLPLVRMARCWARYRATALGEAGTDFKEPPRLLNRLLASLLGGEQRVLLKLLEGERKTGYASGVSLIAVLQRTEQRESASARKTVSGVTANEASRALSIAGCDAKERANMHSAVTDASTSDSVLAPFEATTTKGLTTHGVSNAINSSPTWQESLALLPMVETASFPSLADLTNDVSCPLP